MLAYAGLEIDCIRHNGDVNGLCAQHAKDWNVCVGLMTSVFCPGTCPGIPMVYEDIYARVNATGHFD